MTGEDARLVLEEMRKEDLPENWQALTEEIGLQGILTICRMFGGTNIYIPKTESATAQAKERLIPRLFNGKNHKELARRFELSERKVYDIMAKLNWKRKQTSLFDEP